ncbi:MAG: ferredoxin [Candidatus Anstonellales archaeon]
MAVIIIHEREKCIGCGACAAVCSAYWEMANDGKSKLKGAKNEGGVFKLNAKEEGCNLTAAQSCPVNCIHVEKDGVREI